MPLRKCQHRIRPLCVPSHLLQLTGHMPCLPWLRSQQLLRVYPQASQQLNLLSFGDCGQSPPTDPGPPISLSPSATLHSSQAPTQRCCANCLLPLNPAPSISSSPAWLTPHLLRQAFEDCPTSSPADSHPQEDQGGGGGGSCLGCFCANLPHARSPGLGSLGSRFYQGRV